VHDCSGIARGRRITEMVAADAERGNFVGMPAELALENRPGRRRRAPGRRAARERSRRSRNVLDKLAATKWHTHLLRTNDPGMLWARTRASRLHRRFPAEQVCTRA